MRVLVARVAAFWRNLTQRDRVERELDEEARAFVDLLTAERMRAGMSGEDASRAALIEFGGLEQVKEGVREVRVGMFFEILWRDLRYAFRSLAKSPGFTAASILSLGLGIGGTTGIFNVVSTLLLKPIAARQPGGLAILTFGKSYGAPEATSYHEFSELRRRNTVFTELAGESPTRYVVSSALSIPNVIRFHCSVSRSSCCRPAFVNR